MVFPTVARHFSKPWAIKNEVMRCLSWLYSQSDSSLPAFDQLSDRVVHGHDARGTPCVAATEGIALFKVTDKKIGFPTNVFEIMISAVTADKETIF